MSTAPVPLVVTQIIMKSRGMGSLRLVALSQLPQDGQLSGIPRTNRGTADSERDIGLQQEGAPGDVGDESES